MGKSLLLNLPSSEASKEDWDNWCCSKIEQCQSKINLALAQNNTQVILDLKIELTICQRVCSLYLHGYRTQQIQQCLSQEFNCSSSDSCLIWRSNDE